MESSQNKPPKNIQATVLYLLARREHTRFELKQKLLLKNFPPELIDSTIEKFAANGWQDDERFAQMYARARIERGDGILKLKMKLRTYGLSDAIIAQTLPTDIDFWRQQIQRKWAKKCQPTKNTAQRLKNIRFLQSRGFTLEQIQIFMKSLPGSRE